MPPAFGMFEPYDVWVPNTDAAWTSPVPDAAGRALYGLSEETLPGGGEIVGPAPEIRGADPLPAWDPAAGAAGAGAGGAGNAESANTSGGVLQPPTQQTMGR